MFENEDIFENDEPYIPQPGKRGIARTSFISAYLILTAAVVFLVGTALILLTYLDAPTLEKAQAHLLAGNSTRAISSLRVLADRNRSSQAARMLGDIYHEGKGVPRDLGRALEYLKPAALDGDLAAQKTVGMLYHDGGPGVRQDFLQASVFLKMAADRGDARSQYLLGRLYYRGDGVGRNYDEALRWLSEAAKPEAGIPEASVLAGTMYFHGEGTARSPLRASRHLEAAAAAGIEDPEVHAMLGHLSYDGTEVGRNRTKAFRHFSAAQALGHPTAGAMLGHMLYYGEGTEPDPVLAAEFLLPQAEAGDVRSQALLAAVLYQDPEMPGGMAAARRWAEPAAAAGEPMGAAVLGCLYLRGEGGLENNPREALAHLLRAAERDNIIACTELGELLLTGHAAGTDRETGLRYLRRAASLGSVKARDLLARQAAEEAEAAARERLAAERQAAEDARREEELSSRERERRLAREAEREREAALARARENWELRRQQVEEAEARRAEQIHKSGSARRVTEGGQRARSGGGTAGTGGKKPQDGAGRGSGARSRD